MSTTDGNSNQNPFPLNPSLSQKGCDWFSSRETYRTSKCISNQVEPFRLVYEVEAMVPIKVMVLLARLALINRVSDSYDWIYDVEAFEKMRHYAKNKWLSYQ